MQISELAAVIPGARIHGDGGVEITAVCYDSRRCGPGAAFVAIPGFKNDGHDYIGSALERGVTAIVAQADHEEKWRQALSGRTTPAILVPDARAALADPAAALRGYPARQMFTIGVTGTDGKTSLAHLLAHVLRQGGLKTGLISTAQSTSGDVLLGDETRFTTPEAPEVQDMLRAMLDSGCRWAVIEATSHGLALHRVRHCEFDIGVFTNVGTDHLEFHGSLDGYLAAKGLLFRMLDESMSKGLPKTAVLNADDAAAAYFGSLTNARLVTYGLSSEADVTAGSVATEDWSSNFLIRALGSQRSVTLRRPGKFNIYNALAATAAGTAAELGLDQIVAGLETWPGAPGRMQLVEEGQQFRVVVDFAHSPDSLRRVLELLRSMTTGRTIAVFGCIGERDRDRRHAMGLVVAALADFTIVTDDNPYTEDRWAIIEEIASGLRAGGKRDGVDFILLADRRDAVRRAIEMARDDDVVLLAGKGHERRVTLADSSYECNDAEVARNLLRGAEKNV